MKIKINKSISDIFQLRHLRGNYESCLHSCGFHEVGFPTRTPGPAPGLHILLSQGAAGLERHSFPLGPPPAPTGADSGERGLWPDAQPCQEAHSPLLLQISTLFSNLTFLSTETLRVGSSHARLLWRSVVSSLGQLICVSFWAVTPCSSRHD